MDGPLGGVQTSSARVDESDAPPGLEGENYGQQVAVDFWNGELDNMIQPA